MLVILGLTRPYSGSSHQYRKLRCFIIVIGFLTTLANAHQRSQVTPDLQDPDGILDVKVLSPQSRERLHVATGKSVKRKLETNYATEDKFGARRFKGECFLACPIDENHSLITNQYTGNQYKSIDGD